MIYRKTENFVQVNNCIVYIKSFRLIDCRNFYILTVPWYLIISAELLQLNDLKYINYFKCIKILFIVLYCLTWQQQIY